MRQVISLNKDWKLKDFSPGDYWLLPKQPYEVDYDDSDWLACDAPCDVHRVLLEKGLIPDPFFEMNAEKIRWIEERDWWFRKKFTLPKDFEGKRIELVFEGLDTFASIWLNGELIAENEDMFLPVRVDVTDKVKFEEENVLVVKLASPVLETMKRYFEKYPINLPRAFARKAQYAYGWDWATRLLTIGLWRDVKLQVLDKATIRSVYAWTVKLAEDYSEAIIEVQVEVEAFEEGNYKLEIVLSCKDQNLHDKFTHHLSKGFHIVKRKYVIKKPHLWWPAGLGEQNLYNIRVQLYSGNTLIDEYTTRFGIRTVELVTKGPEAPNGKVFYLKVNGVKVFVKGGNWIPLDLVITRLTPEKYRRAVEMLVEANHNAIRIWGGGLVEYDALYEACDELGVMIWHDFPYSTAYYPTDEHFLELVKRETEAIVRRLRNHPSIVLWCGNNEIDWMMYQRKIKHRGHPVFYKVIPEVLEKLDPSRPYWPSSPWSPENEDPNSMEEGNRHNWYVWHGFEPIERYLEDEARFMTEFGFQALPDIETLKTFLSDKKLWPPNEVWIYHWHMIHKMAYYMKDYGKPRTLRDYILLSQLVQADALKRAAEHFRSRKFACGGCIYWNYNAPWPNMCWEVVDYYLRPKAAYFYLKRAFAPIATAIKKIGDKIEIYAVNDTLSDVSGTVRIRLYDFEGRVHYSEGIPIKVPANESKLIKVISKDTLPEPLDDKMLWVVLEANGRQHTNWTPLVKYSELKLPPASLRVEAERKGSTLRVKLKSDKYSMFTYVKLVNVDPMKVKYSDNYIDLLPGREEIIEIEVRNYDGKIILRVGSLNAGDQVIEI